MKILLFMSVFLMSCAQNVQKTPPEAVALGSVAVAKTVEKIKEVWTPKYPLIVNPAEICDITHDPVKCYIVPCHENCERHIPLGEFVRDNPKVVTVSSSLMVEAVLFCKKNLSACEKYIGQYENKKIVLTQDE